MSLKLFAASVVLLVGFALASLFPKSETGTGESTLAGGVALRRDVPQVDVPDASSSARGTALPTIEAAVAARPEAPDDRTYRVPGSERTLLRSPPPMPPEYRAAATQQSPRADHSDGVPRDPAAGARGRPHRVRDIVHRVVDGDTLPALAARYLGDAALADQIWEANRDKLSENPNWLPIGAELEIPPPAPPENPELAGAPARRGAETRLVPVVPAQVVADAQAR